MTTEEILLTAIEKAVKNGWKPLGDGEVIKIDILEEDRFQLAIFTHETDRYTLLTHKTIFSHDFAKAFWKLDETNYGQGCWQDNLQQMVLEEDPIQYLAKFL